MARPRVALLSSAVATLLVLIADQASKAWAMVSLPRGQLVTVVPGWLWFRLLSNSGASFSLLHGYNRLFASISVLVVLAIGVILVRGHVVDPLSVIALGAVAGGALGNLVDRVRLAAVVDFITVRWWPADFNLADAAIRVGVILFLCGLFLEQRRRTSRRLTD
ncbi:MAG TPA: signal peptidase II [Candidatus Dormibacteraeota bacterium]